MKHHSNRYQAGVALIGAIFLMVILGSLGSYMLSMNMTQQAGGIASLQMTRAHYAARAGLEWAARTVRDSGDCSANGTTFTPQQRIGGETGPGQFTLTFEDCTATAVSESNRSYQVFNIEVTARSNGLTASQPGYAERTLMATVTSN